MIFTVLLFYKYTQLQDPERLREQLLAEAKRLSLTGRILIAHEGINGTVEGTSENAEAFSTLLKTVPELSDMRIKTSEGTGKAFPKLKVRVRNEIVGTRFPTEIDPVKDTGTYLPPEELRRWYEEGEDFEIIDMRNDYEFKSGHFRGSINPRLENSRDLPKTVKKLKNLKDKKVLTVCTGGVRCEKMSAYLKKEGFTDVYQLHDGMHGYMQKYPGKDFLGTLYTFDQRHTMHFGGDREVVGKCHRCKTSTEKYIDCDNKLCHKHLLACDDCKAKLNNHCSLLCKTMPWLHKFLRHLKIA
jgi:UPF0176 protein